MANKFIYISKSSANTLILFVCKQKKNLYLYIDYEKFNNLTIKNRYQHSWIKFFLDRFS